MGLTGASTGARLLFDGGVHKEKEDPQDRIVALAGNPNVGKSTVFNRLTGLNQHTGNWPGKTVASARGRYRHKGSSFLLVDIPGTYSLMANSAEEKIARDFICFGGADAVVVVADATCLERNLHLVLQALEVTRKVVLCVNLMDEAKKKKIRIDISRLSSRLGIPVVGTSARSGHGLEKLMEAVSSVSSPAGGKGATQPLRVAYDEEIEGAAAPLTAAVREELGEDLTPRWIALKLLEGEEGLLQSLKEYLGCDLLQKEKIQAAFLAGRRILEASGITLDRLQDRLVTTMVKACEEIGNDAVTFEKKEYAERDRRIDKILTAPLTGIPIMLLLLFGVFWLTITGANVPSGLLAEGFASLEEVLSSFLLRLSAPGWLAGILVDGVYRTLSWVISVMLPPMAIFFPLFTLLEDLGYLPRVAFNLDNFFRKACAHGKQALTMWVGNLCYKLPGHLMRIWRTGCSICEVRYPRQRTATTRSSYKTVYAHTFGNADFTPRFKAGT